MRHRQKFSPPTETALRENMEDLKKAVDAIGDTLSKMADTPDGMSKQHLAAIAQLERALGELSGRIAQSAAPNAPGLDLEHLGQIVNAMQMATKRPTRVAVEIIRDEFGDVVAMVGTTDPDEIARISG